MAHIGFRIMVHVIVCIFLFCSRSRLAKFRSARILTWVVRWVGFTLGCTEQAGLNNLDSTVIIHPVIITVAVGVVSPVFKNFILCTVIIFAVKPVFIILDTGHGCPNGSPRPCQGGDLRTVLINNAFLLCMALGVFYQVNSDLLSFEVFVSSDFSDTSDADEVAPPADSLNHDTYFPIAERAEQIELWRREAADMSARSVANPLQPALWWKCVGGRGVGGRLLRAVDADGNRLVLKTLPAPPALAPFLRREARRARSLAHPGLLAVLSVEWGRGTMRVVVEYCSRGSVEDVLVRSRRPLEGELARALARQAVEAVAYLHRHRVMHGNLKVDREHAHAIGPQHPPDTDKLPRRESLPRRGWLRRASAVAPPDHRHPQRPVPVDLSGRSMGMAVITRAHTYLY